MDTVKALLHTLIYILIFIACLIAGGLLARFLHLKCLHKKVDELAQELTPLLARRQTLILTILANNPHFERLKTLLKNANLTEQKELEKELQDFIDYLQKEPSLYPKEQNTLLHTSNTISFLKGNYNDHVFLYNDFYRKIGPSFGYRPIPFY